MPDHPLVVGAAGGSIGSLLFSLARQFLEEPLGAVVQPALQECLCGIDWDLEGQTVKVFLLGLLCGILLGPIVDIIWIVRERWRRFVAARVLGGGLSSSRALYKVI